MRRFRFTISSLLGVVLFAGVAFAAMREATALWDHVVFTATACILLVSVLLAMHGTASGRAYWLGFALFGVGYLVASAIPSVGERLATTEALVYLDSKIPGRNPLPFFRISKSQSGGSPTRLTFSGSHSYFVASSHQSSGSVQLWDAATGKLLAGPNGTSENFVRIGQSFIALLAALAGGWISRRLSLSGPRRDEENV